MTFSGLHSGLKEDGYMVHNTGLVGPDASFGGFTNEAKTLFNAMTIQPDIIRKKVINSFILDLKRNGIWDQLDVLWVLASHDRQAAKLNWINPSLYSLTEVSSPTFTTDRGFNGNGSTQYLNTGFNPAVNNIKYSASNMSAGTYIRTNVQETKLDFGCNDGTTSLWMLSRNASDQIQARPNNTSTNTITNSITDSRGFSVTLRTNLGGTGLNYKNGVVGAASGTGSVSLPSANVYILANNNNGTLQFPSTKQNALVFIGNANYDQLTFYNIVQTYMTAIGAQV